MKQILDFIFGKSEKEYKPLYNQQPKTYIAVALGEDGVEEYAPYFVRPGHYKRVEIIGKGCCKTEQEAKDRIDHFIKTKQWEYPKTIKYPNEEE